MKNRNDTIELATLSDLGRGSISLGLTRGNSGWYRLHARCTAPFGKWDFIDECIEVSDISIWANMLDKCVRLAEEGTTDARLQPYPTRPRLRIKFLEPDICLELITAGAAWCRIRIGFQWNAAPHITKSYNYNFTKKGPLWLDLCVPAEQVENLAQHLRAQHLRLGGKS